MRRAVFAVLASVGLACAVYSVRVEEPPLDQPAKITTPVKVHLADGSTAVFRRGVTIDDRTVTGAGIRYDLALAESTHVTVLPLDSVAGLEAYRDQVEVAPTIVLTALGTAAAAVGVAAAAVAIFGSCPTVYADSAGHAVLQAEAFSYSIAPIFEMRDVDLLRVVPDPSGIVRLEVRNEALETHFLNHTELLVVDQAPGEAIVPDSRGQAIAVGRLAPVRRAVDRAGRDVTSALEDPDGVVFASDAAILARATADDLDDFVDLEVPVPAAVDSVALVLRMRNSLLATVLLYDVMLADRGPGALGYLGATLDEIGAAMELGRFASQYMGLRVAVWDGAAYRAVGRLGDSGPVAWKDAAIVVPVTERPVMRVRLSFVTDNWRLDRVAVAESWRHPPVRSVPLARVVRSDGEIAEGVRASLASPDARYLETKAGQHFFAEFAVGSSSEERTFLLAWQGYYTEWIRPSWLGKGRNSGALPPGPAGLAEAMRRWRATQDSTERLFYTTQVPVR